MSKFQISIDLENVDLASLDTEEDFREEAKRLLTKTLIKVGESMGEKTWENLQKGLKGSQSEKRKFILETGRNYQKNASRRERQELEDYIVEQLRQHKKSGN
ncbi:hypothetical protein [Iningainema tapete]|uniref:Uncharacterized protein n=1 Tax=Iningainema tapete BLCC-T55 TaxID=2748662 RepID=A0A8J6XIH1_9CYAN|nr:hypothetical protein [Iningainema tapete]MBD2773890.1 hypothetical protein [Iningainema tapete BLCC-T55]